MEYNASIIESRKKYWFSYEHPTLHIDLLRLVSHYTVIGAFFMKFGRNTCKWTPVSIIWSEVLIFTAPLTV